jgi:SRSO17 transposase
MNWNAKLWQHSMDDFPSFLEPLVAGLGRSERRQAARLYAQGLLMPGERKSIEPMAARLGVDSQRLQQFITDSPWPEQAVWSALRRVIVPLWEPLQAWVVDETGWLKQGDKSVGVARQYCGAVGKTANCQVSVELGVMGEDILLPIGGRLYLPEAWTQNPERCRQAGVPDAVGFVTKPQIARQLMAEALAEGVPPSPLLGDSVYGGDPQLRRWLRAQGLEYFLQAEEQWLAWRKQPRLSRGRKLWSVATRQPKGSTLRALADGLSANQWHRQAWRAVDCEKRVTRLAWLPIYLHADLDEGTGDWPLTWLVADWPEGQPDPYHLYLAWLKQAPNPARSLRLSRSRWPIEQYFQRGKTDLGLDHFEGRSWRGFHHHLVMAAIAYVFISAVLLRSKKNFWPYVGEGVARDPALVDARDRVLPFLSTAISEGNQRSYLT